MSGRDDDLQSSEAQGSDRTDSTDLDSNTVCLLPWAWTKNSFTQFFEFENVRMRDGGDVVVVRSTLNWRTGSKPGVVVCFAAYDPNNMMRHNDTEIELLDPKFWELANHEKLDMLGPELRQIALQNYAARYESWKMWSFSNTDDDKPYYDEELQAAHAVWKAVGDAFVGDAQQAAHLGDDLHFQSPVAQGSEAQGSDRTDSTDLDSNTVCLLPWAWTKNSFTQFFEFENVRMRDGGDVVVVRSTLNWRTGSKPGVVVCFAAYDPNNMMRHNDTEIELLDPKFWELANHEKLDMLGPELRQIALQNYAARYESWKMWSFSNTDDDKPYYDEELQAAHARDILQYLSAEFVQLQDHDSPGKSFHAKISVPQIREPLRSRQKIKHE